MLSSPAQREGAGYGMTFLKRNRRFQTVQAHGGKVAARNRPEGGAEFRILLPVSPETSLATRA